MDGQYPVIVNSQPPPSRSLSPAQGDPYQRLIRELALSKLPADSHPRQNLLSLQWSHPAAVQRLYEIRAALGTDPDALSIRPQGVAVWQHPRGKTGGQYHSFEIRDESSPVVVRLPRLLRERTVRHLHEIEPSA